MSETTDVPTNEPTKSLSKEEIIRDISKALRDRRAARSLTLEKVSQMLKIRLPYLESIENGNWDQLPGEVFVRGFVRRYAQFMGLEADKLIAPYVAFFDSPEDKKVQPIQDRQSDFNKSHLLWGFLGIVLIIGFLKVIKQERNAPVKTITAAAVPAASGIVNASAPVAIPTAPATSQTTLTQHHIEVFSTYPLWLRVNAANKNFEGFIPQADTWSWKGEGTFTIKLGHSKQVTLMFDGKPVVINEDLKKITLPAE